MTKPIILTKADIKNFKARVEKRGPNDCWEWRGAHDKDGYGIFHNHLGPEGWYRAHRVACFLAYGDAGKMTCHKCPDGDNPGCVNPKHLYPGNGKLNSADRDKTPHGIHGEQCHLAKLTNRQVKRIAKLHNLGKTNHQISDCMGIRRRWVQRVCSGECWGWLTGIVKIKIGILRGENSPNAKLTKKQVKRIAKLYTSGKTRKEIAEQLSLNQSSVNHVCSGECWGWLTGF